MSNLAITFSTVSPSIMQIIRAAKNRHIWGRFAARRYIEKRNLSMSAYRLACQLEALEG